MSSKGSRPTSATSGLMQDVPGAFPEPGQPIHTGQLSLSQAIHARRAEYVRSKEIRIKVGTWNTASFKGTEKDIGGWFVKGQGVADALSGLSVASEAEPHHQPIEHESPLDDRETVDSQEARYARKKSTLPHDDPGSVPGGEDIDLYLLGLQEVVDVNSASEALRPFSDPDISGKWRTQIEEALPKGYTLVAVQQLIGLLLLIYASPRVARDIKSVSTTSVGTGLMGYMGNKGAVTARLVLGETTRLVFVNCHMAAGADKTSLERRNWDYGQIMTRTRFEPIQDSMDLVQNSGETIDDADVCFWVGDLNYRLVGIPGDDVRRLLMLHTRNEYDLSQASSAKVEHEIARATSRSERRRRQRSSTESTTSTTSSHLSSQSQGSKATDDSSNPTLPDEGFLAEASDPTSLQATIDSLLPHDELQQQIKKRIAFHQGWQEGPITFLPTYKYDPGSVGVFDSGEKKRAPSWCDRIVFRTRRDRLTYESTLADEEEARKKDAEMKKNGLDEAGKDEELLYDYDPETDAADDDEPYDERVQNIEAPEGVLITKEGFADEMHLESYTAHQRVLSSDHKPLDAIFYFKYDAIVPELKAKVHQEVVRELDKAENEGRPGVTVIVDKNHRDDQATSDQDPAQFEGVWFGRVRYGQQKNRSLTIANTGQVPATISFVDRPIGAGQAAGISPTWLTVKMDQRSLGTSESASGNQQTLEPGDVCNVDLHLRILDGHVARALNEGTKQLDDILVLRVENGRDHFIPLRGKWLESSLGRSIDKLIRIPEGGIRKLQHQRPDDSKARDLDLSVKWSAPRELFRLTEAAESLTEACIAEWSMTANDQSPPWVSVSGWPFAADSWTALEEEERWEGFASVCEALDTDEPLDQCLPTDYTKSQRLEIVAAYCMLFLDALPDGVVTETLWHKVEESMISYEHDKKTITQDDQRTNLQEILSQCPAHSISFILATTMLDRIIREIISTSSQFATGGTLHSPSTPSRGGTWLKRSLSTRKDPAADLGQVLSRTLAAEFAKVMIRAPAPAKDKDRATLDERQRNFVELFLPRDPT